MTALPSMPFARPAGPASPTGRPALRLVGGGGERRAGEDLDVRDAGAPPPRVAPYLRPSAGAKRATSPAVRRRRLLLAVMGLALVGLALPLSGTGGRSHATGSALAGIGHQVGYTVRPGDSLWSIAERVDPTADPRPLVAQLASQTGSETVVPGERIVLP